MHTLPAHPFGTDITSNYILKKMAACRSWEDKYRLIIQLGKKIPPWNSTLKHESIPILGCESKVWLAWQNIDGYYYFAADSDAKIIKGLLALILALIEGKTRDHLKNINFESYFEVMNLLNHISQSRSTGLRSIIEHVKKI
ncbi:cysteine desulfurase sulfur acceptor subunit CsdE [Candidatus Enterovibrio altilux]|uniref:Cysteine desulfurase CsdA-CsdE, sulfur acceptor protein CsdE n=1 Tax=Candidatus Enterovibrio altilux TaxID=1927128 RepID=A0A291BAI5_9GAMM|nr:cysteine desulfurase sulfur acceptor subunit CsdE [Candidatus Enterovibrio luxaltus]ATF10003.1 Cysteine desulfurase CsdA-CsdE, sulfur acceptor protein CsdE [Candidatus Enterovibrio luxaltus]